MTFGKLVKRYTGKGIHFDKMDYFTKGTLCKVFIFMIMGPGLQAAKW